jgi:hypothetical protein
MFEGCPLLALDIQAGRCATPAMRSYNTGGLDNYLCQIGPFSHRMCSDARVRAAVDENGKAKAASDIKKIEETQEALRETIDEAKRLSEQAERLLQKHKKNLQDEA